MTTDRQWFSESNATCRMKFCSYRLYMKCVTFVWENFLNVLFIHYFHCRSVLCVKRKRRSSIAGMYWKKKPICNSWISHDVYNHLSPESLMSTSLLNAVTYVYIQILICSNLIQAPFSDLLFCGRGRIWLQWR